jgi:hypothetical protein
MTTVFESDHIIIIDDRQHINIDEAVAILQSGGKVHISEAPDFSLDDDEVCSSFEMEVGIEDIIERGYTADTMGDFLRGFDISKKMQQAEIGNEISLKSDKEAPSWEGIELGFAVRSSHATFKGEGVVKVIGIDKELSMVKLYSFETKKEEWVGIECVLQLKWADEELNHRYIQLKEALKTCNDTARMRLIWEEMRYEEWAALEALC